MPPRHSRPPAARGGDERRLNHGTQLLVSIPIPGAVPAQAA
jgi:hypothetical protein